MRIFFKNIIALNFIVVFVNDFHLIHIRVVRKILLWISFMTHFVFWILFHSIVKFHFLGILIDFKIDLFDRHCSKVLLRWAYISDLFVKINLFNFKNFLHDLKLIFIFTFFYCFWQSEWIWSMDKCGKFDEIRKLNVWDSSR